MLQLIKCRVSRRPSEGKKSLNNRLTFLVVSLYPLMFFFLNHASPHSIITHPLGGKLVSTHSCFITHHYTQSSATFLVLSCYPDILCLCALTHSISPTVLVVCWYAHTLFHRAVPHPPSWLKSFLPHPCPYKASPYHHCNLHHNQHF